MLKNHFGDKKTQNKIKQPVLLFPLFTSLTISASLALAPLSHLAKESHSEVGAQQSFARVHDLRHFAVGPVERVV